MSAITTPFEHIENQMLQAEFAEYSRDDAEAAHAVHDEYIATRPELLGRLKRALKCKLYSRAYGGR